MKFDRFAIEMDRLSGLKFKPATLQTHWDALEHLSETELVAAVTRAARECDEFPSPRQLREFASPRWRQWSCPHVERCDNREKCASASILGRPEKAAL